MKRQLNKLASGIGVAAAVTALSVVGVGSASADTVDANVGDLNVGVDVNTEQLRPFYQSLLNRISEV